ncbi:MAG TPA: nucleotidyltransferase domain-containing protein [Candidatus Acidoferrales bacterium]
MEAKLNDYVKRLQDSGGKNLKAVVLYGSAVTGEFRAGHSDLNTLCIVERASSEDLENLHGAAEWWTRQGNHPPLVFTLDELHRSADVFAIELLDMKQSHRILFGDDFLAKLDVPLRQHRLQVERELRTNWLRLRQTVLTAPLSHRAHLAIMSQSVSAFCALFRHALFALGQPLPVTKREAVAAVAAFTGADPAGFNAILDLRDGAKSKGQIDVEGSLNSYVEFVAVVTNEVDRRLEVA